MKQKNALFLPIIGLLDDSRDLFGEGKAFEYAIRKRFGRLELQIKIAGERFNPFEDGAQAENWEKDRSLRDFFKDKSTTLSYNYIAGVSVQSCR